MIEAALSACGVTKKIGATTIVDGVDLNLRPREITALLGPSGAGKSTLLRLLAGLEGLDAGEVTIGGSALSRPGLTVPPEKRQTGLVFQDFALFPHLTALENVRFGLPHLTKADGRALALSWLDRMQLAARSGAYPAELSGGEQQRVAIARALAPQPAAILMDEPFSGLDPALRGGVAALTLAVIRDAGVPALWVTHDPSEAMMLADTLAVMQSGQIVQSGPPETVYRSPIDLAVAQALGPINEIRLTEDAGVALVRPEDLVLDPDGPIGATVTSVQFTGPTWRLLAMADGQNLMIDLPASTLPPASGSAVHLTIRSRS
ncbi:MAG: ABC transporter ATP-binding protein [Pseudomonadota bacterium]